MKRSVSSTDAVNTPQSSDSAARVVVLAVTAEKKDHDQLRRIFSRSNWTLHQASTCREAMDSLEDGAVGVLVAASELPDGTWRNLLESIRTMALAPMLIVTSDHAETSLWADVLNLGAYDVLAKPFDQGEVIRVISLAWLQWRDDIRRRETSVPGSHAHAA